MQLKMVALYIYTRYFCLKHLPEANTLLEK